MSENTENIIPYSLVEGNPDGDLVKVNKQQLQTLIQQHAEMKTALATVAQFAAEVTEATNSIGIDDKSADIASVLMGIAFSPKKQRQLKKITSMFSGEVLALLTGIVNRYHPESSVVRNLRSQEEADTNE